MTPAQPRRRNGSKMSAAEVAPNSGLAQVVQQRTNSGCSQDYMINTLLLTPDFTRQDSFREVGGSFNPGYENFLLVFVPIGIVAGALNLAPVAVFVLNFLAIVPLAPFIAMAVIRLSADAGLVWGGLLKAILGNAVEMMVRFISRRSPHFKLLTVSFILGK